LPERKTARLNEPQSKKKKRKIALAQFFLTVFVLLTICTLPSSFLRAAKSKRSPQNKNTRQKIQPPRPFVGCFVLYFSFVLCGQFISNES
jgi:flagellar basal body-associated protein FliL